MINRIDELRFRTHKEKHEMSHLHESKIQNMGNAGRNGGEYYTPRPLIKTIVKVVAPKIGDKIYDGAVGSAGFLCESFEYLKQSKGKHENLTSKDTETLQKKTFYGKEKKSLAYIIGTMNMILHGVEAPNIVHTNTLAENLSDIQERDRYDVVLANPPFGGKERAEVQQNFPIETGETAFYFWSISSPRKDGVGKIIFQQPEYDWENHIIDTFRFELGKVETQAIRERIVGMLSRVNKTLAEKVAEGLGIAVPFYFWVVLIEVCFTKL